MTTNQSESIFILGLLVKRDHVIEIMETITRKFGIQDKWCAHFYLFPDHAIII